MISATAPRPAESSHHPAGCGSVAPCFQGAGRMQSRYVSQTRLVVLVFVFGGLSGCGSPRPQAPALQDEPIYQNNREGFRFISPEGWKQLAKSDLPEGELDKERLLVRYMPTVSGRGATLEVTMADLPESTDLAKYLAGPSLGVKEWKALSAPVALDINGMPATRLAYSGRIGKVQYLKEVTVFRRRERVYFFTALVPRGDTKSREIVRRAVASTTWR